MRLALVPVGDGGDVVLALVELDVVVAEVLERHAQVLLERDRVGKVPPVEAVPGQRVVVSREHRIRVRLARAEAVARGVARRAVRVAGEQRVEALRLGQRVGRPVEEGPGTAEVVLGSRRGDRWELLVAVEEELHLALAPPIALQGAQGHVGADVVALAAHAVEHGVVDAPAGAALAVKAGVEVHGVVRHVGERVVERVEDVLNEPGVLARKRDLGVLPEGHLEVAVHAARRVHADGHRVDDGALTEAVAEEVADRALDRGGLLVVPVEAQHEVTHDEAAGGGLVGDGHPDVADDAGALDVRERDGLAGLKGHAARALAADAEVAGRHGGAALLARDVLGGDGAAFLTAVHPHVLKELSHRRPPLFVVVALGGTGTVHVDDLLARLVDEGVEVEFLVGARERDRHGEREVDTRDHVDPVGGEAGKALVHAAAVRVGEDDDLVSARKSRLDRRVEPLAVVVHVGAHGVDGVALTRKELEGVLEALGEKGMARHNYLSH